MYINNRMASLVYKLVLIVVCIVGLVLNSGLVTGTFAPYMLLYYTIMSNLFCLVFYIASAINTGLNIKKSGKIGPIRFAPHFKGAVVMAMLLTSIIYFFVLSDGSFAGSSAFAMFANIIVHFVVPLMVLADWLIFDKKGRFAAADPLVWLAVPFAYYAIVLIMAEPSLVYVSYYGGVHYPYRFINPDLINWAQVLVNIFIITICYTAVGYLLFGADYLMNNYARNKARARAEAAKAALPEADNSAELNSLDDLMHKSAGGAIIADPAMTATPVTPPVQPAAPDQPPAAAPQAPPTNTNAGAGQSPTPGAPS